MRSLPPVTRTPLHLSLDPRFDVLEALAFGTVHDGQPPALLRAARAGLALHYVLSAQPRRTMGFVVREPWACDPHAEPALFAGPRFAVPVLGLDAATPGEVLLAVHGRFSPGEPTNDALCLQAGVALAGSDPDAALDHLRLALEAGQLKALFAMGCLLLEHGRAPEAYERLRRYAEIAPWNGWAWHRLARACEELGLREEARAAARRAEILRVR